MRAAIERHGERLLRRIFTPLELQECKGRVDSLAARLAAKEAVAKALGCGIGLISWQEVEIRRGAHGEPVLGLRGAAAQLAEEQGLREWALSLSHSRTHAIALVVAMG